jgi:peptide chain release factor subunit 1
VIPSFIFDVLVDLMKEDVPPIGCIVMSGNSTTLYTVRGTEITLHLNIDVSLPNKQGRGGQSQKRFERLGDEARHNYISKVIEAIIRVYNSNLPLIVGGPAHLKDKMVDRIREINTAPKIIRVVDIQYDKKTGLHELLSQCNDLVASLQIEKERYWIEKFMTSLALDDNLAVYGNKNIMYALETGVLATLILHEDNNDGSYEPLCLQYGTDIISITSFLPEANQIKHGFGGIVGILRYPIMFQDDYEDEE